MRIITDFSEKELSYSITTTEQPSKKTKNQDNCYSFLKLYEAIRISRITAFLKNVIPLQVGSKVVLHINAMTKYETSRGIWLLKSHK